MIKHLLQRNDWLTKIIVGIVVGKNSRERPTLSHVVQIIKDMYCTSYCLLKIK